MVKQVIGVLIVVQFLQIYPQNSVQLFTQACMAHYFCSTYKKRSRTACTMHSIKHNRLEAAVLFAIQYQVSTAVSYSEIVAHINAAPLKKSQSHRLNDQIAAKEKELTKITR